jgi:hypothetical protein
MSVTTALFEATLLHKNALDPTTIALNESLDRGTR